ncbi:MAG: phosphatase domain-containing protein [Ideonella sp.]|nr:phosphatase domain-containing protein [Ideonella sp.]
MSWRCCCPAASTASLAQAAGQNIVDDAWATAQGYRFSGRLTEDKHQPAAPDAGRLSTLYRSTCLLTADSAEGEVSWKVGELSWATRSDSHGYWLLHSNHALNLKPGWHEISTPAASSPAGLLVHEPRNRVGIISDIDDTILASQVPSTPKLLKNSLTVPPEARQAMPGMAALYSRLTHQNSSPAATPLFYVSGSPKQLTDSVRRFLAKQAFPRGVLMLKQVSSDSPDPLSDQQAYKVARIQQIMKSLPEVKFILVGDDGERDPEAYAEIQKQFPQQVASIWIRRVHPDPKRERLAGQQDVAELLKQ